MYPKWVCWGTNAFGEADSQPLVDSSLVLDASVGRHFLCAVLSFEHDFAATEGSLWCWGRNEEEQTDFPKEWFSKISRVVAGDYHTCALREQRGGCWGDNSYGQLDINGDDWEELDGVGEDGGGGAGEGDRFYNGMSGDRVDAKGRDGGSANGQVNGHANGQVNGQVNGHTNGHANGHAKRKPKDKSNEDKYTKWYKYQITKGKLVAIHARNYSTCIVSNTEIKCFGKFNRTIFQYDHYSSKFDLTLGYNHLCFFYKDINCMGDNELNQLTHPSISEMIYMDSKGDYTCAILQTESNNITCWGDNSSGQQDITLDNWNVVSLETAEQHTCLMVGLWYFKCFGTSKYRLNKVPSKIQNYGLAVSLGGSYSCFILGGSLRCIGKNKNSLFDIPPYLSHGLDIVAAGYVHMCASDLSLTTDKSRVSCWGLKDNRIISPPYYLNNGKTTIIDLYSGYKFSCAIYKYIKNEAEGNDKNNELTCWGINSDGQLDYKEFENFTPETHTKEHYKKIRLGSIHACAKTTLNNLHCWGNSNQGQAKVPDYYLHNIEMVSTGYYHTCAVNLQSECSCWGLNAAGQADVPLSLWRVMGYVYAGGNHSCGFDQQNTVSCWGSNAYKQLGVMRQRVKDMSLGERHTCSTEGEGWVACWGDNRSGQTDVSKAYVE